VIDYVIMITYLVILEICSAPDKIARLMADYGADYRVDSEEFRPLFEELLWTSQGRRSSDHGTRRS
jgi:hypothetical protein